MPIIIPQDHFLAREIPEHPGCVECWDPQSFTGRLAKGQYGAGGGLGRLSDVMKEIRERKQVEETKAVG